MTAKERLRILRAARDGRLYYNDYGRYVIKGEKQRPNRAVRERLMREGFIFLQPRLRTLGCAAEAEIAGLEALLGVSVEATPTGPQSESAAEQGKSRKERG